MTKKEELEKEAEEYIKNKQKPIGKYDLVAFTEAHIADLEKENERLKGDLELWESGACRATNLDKCGVVKELKAQIEKMKCCAKCVHCNTYITSCTPQKRFVRLEDVCEDFELRR